MTLAFFLHVCEPFTLGLIEDCWVSYLLLFGSHCDMFFWLKPVKSFQILMANVLGRGRCIWLFLGGGYQWISFFGLRLMLKKKWQFLQR